jgi:hypothetical protein
MDLALLAASVKESRTRWDEFLSNRPPALLSESPVQEALIPLYGTPYFDQLSDQEKRRFYFGFAQFNAEVIVFLEDLLLFSFRRFLKELAPDTREKMSSIVKDEFQHSKGYRKFLKEEPAVFWPEKKFFLDSAGHYFKGIAMGIASRSPMSMAIPGARLEAYSIHLSTYLSRQYGSPLANEWTRLNHLHMLDESRHVPFEFELYEDTMNLRSHWTTVTGGLLFVLFTQWVLLRANWRMVNCCADKSSLGRRMKLTFHMAFWAVRQFPPYEMARKQIKKLLEDKKPPYGRLFQFLTW